MVIVRKLQKGERKYEVTLPKVLFDNTNRSKFVVKMLVDLKTEKVVFSNVGKNEKKHGGSSEKSGKKPSKRKGLRKR